MIGRTEGEPEDPSRRRRRRAGMIAGLFPGLRPGAGLAPAHRLLFLDDDPCRAAAFLKDHPAAVWVTTVPECLAHLAETWDEVHLDHDLGGKTFVDTSDADCGMEVIRWLCKEPRPHLKDARFLVHTHNVTAGLLMVLAIREAGYRAEFRPFGLDLERLLAHNESGPGPAPGPPLPFWTRLTHLVGSFWRGRAAR